MKAIPTDIQTLLNLKWLLADIQKELDASWAILGEVYGSSSELDVLGLTIRRIRSNLDDEKSMEQTLPFVPWKLGLQADPMILALLTGPLYNWEPTYGLRELLQNAVDACWAREDFIARHPQADPDEDLEPDVLIELHFEEDFSGTLTIHDKGIGMSPEIIRDYFLRAGASFRYSSAWKGEYEDHAGHARILRSGRFGIGVLAGFLIGNRIEVSTRHITAPKEQSLSFSFQIDDKMIELRKTSRSVGTTIVIHFNAETGWKNLNQYHDLQWWCLAKPSVVFQVSGRSNQIIEQKVILPEMGASLPTGWRRIEHPDYKDIQWTYVPEATIRVVCNGIEIRDAQGSHVDPFGNEKEFEPLSMEQVLQFNRLGERTGVQLSYPALSIFDSDAKLPLNLVRTHCSIVRASFTENMLRAVCCDLIAYMLVHAPDGPITDTSLHVKYASFRYPGLPRQKGGNTWFWCSNKGISLCDLWYFNAVQPRQLVVLPYVDSSNNQQSLFDVRNEKV